MRPSTMWYTLKQGFKNIKRNWMFSIASILTMSACILLFGIFYSIINNVSGMAQKMEEQVPITVFFEEGTSEERILEIGEKIKERPEVELVVYESADEAWENFKKIYFEGEEDAAEGFKDDNPLVNHSNYQVHMNDIAKQEELVNYIQGLESVREIKKSDEAANTLSSINRIIYYVSATVIAVLLIISIFLISTTVSVGITVRKEEIGIMKYIGATDGFVRAPFLLEGIILGIIGAVIPLGVLYFGYIQVVELLKTFTIFAGAVELIPVGEIYRVLLPVGLALGIGIGFIGSFLTTRKHLRV